MQAELDYVDTHAGYSFPYVHLVHIARSDAIFPPVLGCFEFLEPLDNVFGCLVQVIIQRGSLHLKINNL